jgi:DUF1680 family protein
MPPVRITSGFWAGRLEVNARQAIFHQWEQLEASGCIANFRLAAGEEPGFRTGFFFADSDAYKWLDAAARIWAGSHEPRLLKIMDDFIDLIGRAQMPDGYIFTYNQLHFPEVRWRNLQVEHELYCHGHLIEAGVSHFLATGQTKLLDLARRVADRVVADFSGKGAEYTPGHEEIEIALLRLHEVTGEKAYLEMAEQFIARRGRIPRFGWLALRQYLDTMRRMKRVAKMRQAYYAAHPDAPAYTLPPGNPAKHSTITFLRWIVSNLTGKYNQQHLPVAQQDTPVGHAVRFAYLNTAAARLTRRQGGQSFRPALEAAWDRMVRRRMYLTGGLGSLPGLEGFGNDDELDPEYAYAETCAALGSLFWNWEMAQLTGQACYSDLFEWQLYNAALVGMGLDGRNYLYNNPLASRGHITRRPWYAVPCCPSNLSRTLADLGNYIYSTDGSALVVHQYISSEMEQDEQEAGSAFRVRMDSALPWQGRARLTVTAVPALGPGAPAPAIKLRRPGWATRMSVTLNGKAAPAAETRPQDDAAGRRRGDEPAAAFDPKQADFVTLQHSWAVGDVIEMDFDLPVCLRRAPRRVHGYRHMTAVTRGPLVYCLESTDNPGVDIFSLRLDPASFAAVEQPDLLGGAVILRAKTTEGQPLTFIPYFLWGNRGASQMTVWVRLP